MVIQLSGGTKGMLRDHIDLKIILQGIVISYLITIPIFMIFAFVLSYTNFPEQFITPVVILTSVISIVTAGAITARKVKNRGWLNGSIVGLTYVIILYLASSMVYQKFTVNPYIILKIIFGLVGGSIGGIIGVNFRKRVRNRKENS